MVSISSLLNPMLPPPPSSTSTSPSPFSTPMPTNNASLVVAPDDVPQSPSGPRGFTTINYHSRPCPPQIRPPHLLPPPRDAHSYTSSPRPAKAQPASAASTTKLRGPVRYPPTEPISDPALLSELSRWNIQPPINRPAIASNPRHIPYNSEKKGFWEKTGRESFEVFQYTFQLPAGVSNDDDKTYTVMWDYTTGLVRITPFFKACRYSKTTPAKMLNLNPGLRQLSHSITGGALAAQGYWMPFEAARAVARTFAWPIRWALVPVFGEGFVGECVPVDDERFAKMSIPAEVVSGCVDEAAWLRRWALGEVGMEDGGVKMGGVGATRGVETRGAERGRERYAESGYGTDTDPGTDAEADVGGRERFYTAPLMDESVERELPGGMGGDVPKQGHDEGEEDKRATRTSLRIRREAPAADEQWRQKERSLDEAQARMEAAIALVKLKRGCGEICEDETSCSDEGQARGATDDHGNEQGEESDDGGSSTDDEHRQLRQASMASKFKSVFSSHYGKTKAERLSRDARAAYLLMQLQCADEGAASAAVKDGHRAKRRRASSWP